MPVGKCQNCGGQSNSTTSDYWILETGHGKITECYAKFVKGKWVAGCALESAGEAKTFFARILIKEDKERKP